MPKNSDKKKNSSKGGAISDHKNQQNSQLNEIENTNKTDKDKLSKPSNEKFKTKQQQRKHKRHVNFNEIVYAFRIGENWKVINWKENLKTENEQQLGRRKKRHNDLIKVYKAASQANLQGHANTPNAMFKRIRKKMCRRQHK